MSTFDEFVHFKDDVVVTAVFTNAEILVDVVADHDHEEEDTEE